MAGQESFMKSVIICETFPWWSLVATKMGSRVLSAWSYNPHILEFIREYCQHHPSYDATKMNRVFGNITCKEKPT